MPLQDPLHDREADTGPLEILGRVQAMEHAVRQVTGRRAKFGGVPGPTDGTILRTQLGIPIVTCGPGDRLVPHQVNEYVDVAQLVAAARIYVASALNFLGAA